MNRIDFRSRTAALALFSLLGLGAQQSGYAAGEVTWFNLLTENSLEATRFYSELFGWQFERGRNGNFIALRNGVPFAGVSQIEDRLPEVSESLWLAAIKVDDVAGAVEMARSLDATIHEDVTHLEGWGTYALIQDPQGAPFIVAVPERYIGGTEGFSGWEWAELWTHDTAAAAEFYSAVIGYELEEVPVNEHTYSAFRIGTDRHSGLMSLDDPETAPRWAPYVGVTDLRGILVRVWQAGGSVLFEPAQLNFDIGGEGRVALIADPSGAVLFLHQLEGEAVADPLAEARQITGSDIRQSGGNRNPNVSISVGYGFGPGWGAAGPGYPYRPFGPYYPYRY
jgi:predicted enzyme related to lactoylglutathione lyase